MTADVFRVEEVDVSLKDVSLQVPGPDQRPQPGTGERVVVAEQGLLQTDLAGRYNPTVRLKAAGVSRPWAASACPGV
jgi:hypothetical protein